jgi:hypothetical protein
MTVTFFSFAPFAMSPSKAPYSFISLNSDRVAIVWHYIPCFLLLLGEVWQGERLPGEGVVVVEGRPSPAEEAAAEVVEASSCAMPKLPFEIRIAVTASVVAGL